MAGLAALFVLARLCVYAAGLVRRFRRRSIARIIAVEGNIASGKTTLVATLARTETGVRGEREHVPVALLDAFYEDPERYGLALELVQETARTALLEQVRATTRTGHVLLDRSLVGSRAFALYNYARGTLDPEAWRVYRASTPVLQRAVADVCVVYLHRPPRACAREQARRGTNVIDVDYLRGVHAAHLVVLATLTGYGVRVLVRPWAEYARVPVLGTPSLVELLAPHARDADTTLPEVAAREAIAKVSSGAERRVLLEYLEKEMPAPADGAAQ